jgi:hypothetical protein
MSRQIIRLAAALLALLLAAPAGAQVNPQNLPANSVVGRLGVGPGPAQAVPFSILTNQLLSNSIVVTRGGVNPNIIINANAGFGSVNVSDTTCTPAQMNSGPFAGSVVGTLNVVSCGATDTVLQSLRISNSVASGGNLTTIAHFSGSFGPQPSILLVGSRGAPGSASALVTADTLGAITNFGFDGTNWEEAADILCQAFQNWTSTAHGTYCDIFTTPNNTSAMARSTRFNASGGVSIGGVTDPGVGNLLVAGNIQAISTASTFGIQSTTSTGKTIALTERGGGRTTLAMVDGANVADIDLLGPTLEILSPGTTTFYGNGSTLALTITTGGQLQLPSTGFTANGAVATALSSIGPTGSHTTVQEWLTILDSAGTVRYVPAF